VIFLAPIFLAAGATIAVAVVLLHFLARRRPRPAILPTARFVPDRPARWPSRAPRPTDWLLLAVRVLAIGAIAAAFAGPIREPDRAVTSRIVLVDASRGVGDERAMRDSVIAVLREGDVLVPFDTSARVIATGARDTAAKLTGSRAPASLSAALIAAQRAAALLRQRTDSVELVMVSPFASASWDEATSSLRGRWPGRARLITVPLSPGDSSSRGIDVQAPRSDPVSAAAAPFASDGGASTRIVRSGLSAPDSVWAGLPGHVLVHWPRGEDGDSLTAQAVVGTEVVLAAPLVRRAIGANGARVVARFADGAPAIVERPKGSGCIRDVAFDLPSRGDVALRESTRRLVGAVSAPCDGDEPRRAFDASRLDSLRGAGRLLATSALPTPVGERSPAMPWLLIGAALLLMTEVGLRQGART
jgi:hypothetical protein